MWCLWRRRGRLQQMRLIAVLCVLFLASAGAAELPDATAMSALRRELKPSPWPADPEQGYCSWRGVGCAVTGAVTAIALPRRGLSGDFSAVAQLKLLAFLDLSFNSFAGEIPPSLAGAEELKFLNLSNNLLAGAIPDELKNLKKLQEIQISGNNITGVIPEWVADLAELRVFSAYENSLSGTIPSSLGSKSQFKVLNLHSNALGGGIPESVFLSGQLQVLVLTLNKLNGSIPDAIGQCRGLSNLRIGNNRLAGKLPASIGNMTSLAYFEADNNFLSGEIPPQLASCPNLTLLNLAYNDLTGTVPESLGMLTGLQELIVSGNKLAGGFPEPILKCRSLSKLDLSNNWFNGSLPETICSSSRLQFLVLDHNEFSGSIPPAIGNCSRLIELQLGSNRLSGIIPPEIGKIKNLQIALNLSFNRIGGSLPIELGKLDKLVSLDLSGNEISGKIPVEMRGMQSLIEVNLSDNHLIGTIPEFAPFQKSPPSCFSGNPGLCGEPLEFPQCSNRATDESDHKVSWKAIVAAAGCLVSVVVAVSVVVGLFMWREKQEKDAEAAAGNVFTVEAPPVVAGNVFVESLKQAVDFDSCVKATFKEENKTSSGTFSAVYTAVMPSGVALSVRKLKSVDAALLHHRSKMIRELESLAGAFGHPNLMRPVGYIVYDDAVLLLHHRMLNGTLRKLLDDERCRPNWPRMLSIATGVAEGLAFLHQSAIIHLDISSGNIFVDANHSALLGEVEISKVLRPAKGTASISAVAGSFGYIPPEYAYTMQVTASGNVYSFGVVLLEILTARAPVDDGFGEGVDLVKWVHGAAARGETPEQILDPKLSTVSFAWRRKMLDVLAVAMVCTDGAPARRPKMKKVVEMLLAAADPSSSM